MEEDIANIIIDQSTHLTSEAGDIDIVCNGDSAKLSISHDSDSPFFSVSVPVFDRSAKLYDAGQIISDYMLAKGISFGNFIIKESSSTEIHKKFLLSERFFDGGFNWIKNYPLLAAYYAVLPSYGYISFHAFPNSLSNCLFSINYKGSNTDGFEIAGAVDFTYLAAQIIDGAIVSICKSVPDMISFINSAPVFSSSELEKLDFLRIECFSGTQRVSASFYIIDDPDMIEFKFKNNFGLWEHIYFHAEVMPELKSDAQLALLGNRVVQYDVENSQSFSVSAINIAASEWPRVSQFISSRQIFDAYGRQILLSDVNSEIGKTYDGLGSIKFNYRFADSRIIAD